MRLQNALEKGLLPDDATLHQLVQDRNSVVYGQAVQGLAWPEDPLRPVLISALHAPVALLDGNTDSMPHQNLVSEVCFLVMISTRSILQTKARPHVGRLAQLGVARFACKYPAVMDALLRALLELICKYNRTVMG